MLFGQPVTLTDQVKFRKRVPVVEASAQWIHIFSSDQWIR